MVSERTSPNLARSVTVLIVGALTMLSVFSGKPANLGVVDGRLAVCPASPNCVSTQAEDAGHRMKPIPFTGSAGDAMQHVKDLLSKMPRTKIVTVADHYLHVEFRSSFFRFVDDVEFLIDPEGQLIHFRSASRVGYSDLGVNRRRMEQIRNAFEQE
jgi:uncharacterized protein (DUF1499 family)